VASGSAVSLLDSNRFDLIFLVVPIPLSVCEFTHPHIFSNYSSPRTGLLGAKGANFMSQLLCRFLNDQSGATAIEYGLIAAGISVAIIAAVNGIGTKLNTSFGSISTQLK
jgi:pilus assembly protein Flp/PilA